MSKFVDCPKCSRSRPEICMANGSCDLCRAEAKHAVAAANPWKKTKAEYRYERDVLLDKTDWTQTGDQDPEISERWKPYRRALKDMDFSDLDNIVFPTPPEKIDW